MITINADMIIKIGGRARPSKIVPYYLMISNHSAGNRTPLMLSSNAREKHLSY